MKINDEFPAYSWRTEGVWVWDHIREILEKNIEVEVTRDEGKGYPRAAFFISETGFHEAMSTVMDDAVADVLANPHLYGLRPIIAGDLS